MSVDLRLITGWVPEQNEDWEEVWSLIDEFTRSCKEEKPDQEAIDREQARFAQELYRDVKRRLLESGELSNFEDLPPYPDPGCCLVPPSPSPSPEMYIYRPVIMHTPSPPPRPRRPRPPLPSFKSLSLEVEEKKEETLEKKTEINDDKAKGHKNKNRVVSKRKMKCGRNVEKTRRGKGQVS